MPDSISEKLDIREKYFTFKRYCAKYLKLRSGVKMGILLPIVYSGNAFIWFTRGIKSVAAVSPNMEI